MNDLSDEVLLKRATHAGRNLIVLAILASLVAAACAALGFLVPGAPKIFPVLAFSVSLVATAYWVLAVAGRRGNPNSVGIVIIVMAGNLFLQFILAGIEAARSGTDVVSHMPNVLVSFFILYALYQSRKVLLELQERGLWEQAFPATQPTASLCILGGILLVSGVVTVNMASGYVGWKYGQARTVEQTYAHGFVKIIQEDERGFLTSMQALSEQFSKAQLQEALDKIEGIETKVQLLKKQSPQACQLQKILDTYGSAVRQYKGALLLLKQPKPETERFTEMIKLGDRLRTEAGQAFDRQYGKDAAMSKQL
jgi:hypothetical protein